MIHNTQFSDNLIKTHNGIYLEHTIANHETEFHVYKCFALIYIAHGEGRFYLDNSSFPINEGDIFLLTPDTAHCFVSTLPIYDLSVYCCLFDASILPYSFDTLKNDFSELSDFFEGQKKFVLVCDTGKKIIRNYLIKMLDDFMYSQPSYKYYLRCTLNSALIDLFRIYCANCNKKNNFNSNMTMGLLINYINKNIHSKISIENAAKLLNFTAPYLCRFFKKNTGMTFTEFVNRARVDKIKDELENTDRPIYVIYDDFELTPQYINTIFKKYTGYTLSEYKNRFNYKTNNVLFNTKPQNNDKL